MKFLIPYARTFTYQRSFQNVEQPSPDSSRLFDARQLLQGGSANRRTPLDSYRTILTELYEGHSRIIDNEFIARKVLLDLVLFIMLHEDTYSMEYKPLDLNKVSSASFMGLSGC